MAETSAFPHIDDLVDRLVKANWKERDGIKAELLEASTQHPNRSSVREHLEGALGGLSLELRWEIQEVIDALTPPPPPAEEPEEEEVPEDPNRPLTSADLDLVYDDPRGLMLHRTKKGDRWFATQRDPRTGQPQTFELHPSEIQQLQTQLHGSPFWVLGSGMVG